MSDSPSWIGKSLGGRYQITELLGQGGMSAVYKAFDPNLKRIVAIKLIHPHLAGDPRFIVRFEEEASAVAQLRHPNIVQVYDFNHDHDIYYMVQEFIPGETLQDQLRRLNQSKRNMPIPQAIQYISNICDAAGYAHKRGMIHRDIKPANIMLDVHQQAILMDFGIVKIVGGDSHTATGAVVGTAIYLAPELIRNEIPDPRSDIYALGVTLFEALSGRPPFVADSAMSVLMMHLNDPLPDLRTIRADLPENLIAVVEKSLKKDRSERYTSMQEMANDLQVSLASLSGIQGTGPTLADDIPTLAEAGVVVSRVKPPIALSSQKTGLEPIDQSLDAPGKSSKSTNVEVNEESHEGESTLPTPPIQPAESLSSSQKFPRRYFYIGGGVIGVLILLVLFIIFIQSKGDGVSGALPPTQAPASETIAVDTVTPTLGVTATSSPTVTFTPAPTNTPIPSATLGLPPTATFPAGVPFVFIQEISLDESGRYLVSYDTLEYTEVLPGQHVHFFFDTVPPEEAGSPGNGPWILWGGPRPFNRYSQKDRPEDATQMCVLVANPNHSVQDSSGNCMILPDVNAVTVLIDTTCMTGPDPAYPVSTNVTRGDILRVLGMSPDEQWWNVRKPSLAEGSCWLPQPLTHFHGDFSTLALVEPPNLQDVLNPDSLRVEIQAITLDSQGRYVVDYTTQGFAEQLPGTHIHFFFDNVPPEEVGINGAGNRLMFGGPSPFMGYLQSNKPDGVTKMCALVANPDHSVILDSGNCFPLP